ncbi:MAG TPA: hypothetical protein VEG65_01410 [Candidatus Bathyarchaeia archaeon]|nr:hypothetical protein [Candidatus Bathyarchaeia archaeon]
MYESIKSCKTRTRDRLTSLDAVTVLRYIVIVALFVLFVSYRLNVLGSYVIPTYGNTMYHVGIERLTLITGHYPTQELSYNGGFPNFYVPAYRLLIVSQSAFSGIDPMIMSGLMTVALAIAVFGAVYGFSKQLVGASAAVCALFFLTLSPGITIFTIRALPELLGLIMLPLTLFFVLINRARGPFKFNGYVILSVIAAAVTALTHQITLLVLALVLGVYALTQIRNRTEFLNAVVPLVALIVVYGLWQLYSLHTLSIFGLAQVKYHEGIPVDFFGSATTVGFFDEAGLLVVPFAVIGIAWLEIKKVSKRFLLYSWILASFLLTKNDLLGIDIFMDRFLTFFIESLVIAGGIGAFAVLQFLDLRIGRALERRPAT